MDQKGPNQLYPDMPSAPEDIDPSKLYPAQPPAYSEVPQNYPGPIIVQQQAPPVQPASTPATTTTTTTTTIFVTQPDFPSKSVRIKCHYCQSDIRTRVEAKSSGLTWLFCTLLCVFGCFCGCCLIPFCTNGTRNILHFCPKCKKYLGSHERLRFGRRG